MGHGLICVFTPKRKFMLKLLLKPAVSSQRSHMAKLSDLPVETLLDIIDCSLQSWDHSYDRILQLNNLSLVCRYFHDVTAPITFRNYRLQLRESPGKLGAPDPTCFLTGTSLLTWNEVGFRARLAHLRKNAIFVRELRIIDWGQSLGRVCLGHEPAPASFDPTFMSVLLDTLDALTEVTSVVFEATKQKCTQFPVELWHWLSHVKPTRVSFEGSFAFPSPLRPLPSVQLISICASAEASRVIQASLHLPCWKGWTIDIVAGRASCAPRYQH